MLDEEVEDLSAFVQLVFGVCHSAIGANGEETGNLAVLGPERAPVVIDPAIRAVDHPETGDSVGTVPPAIRMIRIPDVYGFVDAIHRRLDTVEGSSKIWVDAVGGASQDQLEDYGAALGYTCL